MSILSSLTFVLQQKKKLRPAHTTIGNYRKRDIICCTETEVTDIVIHPIGQEMLIDSIQVPKQIIPTLTLTNLTIIPISRTMVNIDTDSR